MRRTNAKRKIAFWGVLVVVLTLPVWLLTKTYRQNRLDDALIAALKRDDAQTALSLLAQGADPNARDWPTEQRPFWQLLWPRRLAEVPQYIPPSALFVTMTLRPSPERTSNRSPRGLTYMDQWALSYPLPENPVLIKALLDKGANVNETSQHGESPLLWAINYGHEETALLLLNHGANIHAINLDGNTALVGAVHSGSEPLVKALLERGANPNQMRLDPAAVSNGKSLWEYHQCPVLAMAVLHLNLPNVLLNGGADINAKDSEGRTALLWATFSCHEETVRLLLKRGADVTITAKNGDTALSVARKLGYANLTRRLQRAGAKQ